MSFIETVRRARALLREERRLSLAALKLEFELDDARLGALIDELVDVQQVAAREGKILTWLGAGREDATGRDAVTAASLEPGAVAAERAAPADAERRQLTVMFCDLVEATALSEQLDPEDLRDVVQRYQRAAAGVVERYGGHVAQHLGDGLLVYFGYPHAHEDDPRRAVTSGLGIVRALEGLSDELQGERGIRLAVRIGIHTGAVVAGEVGAGQSTERLALGSTPNVAARLQAVAQPGEVVLSEATHRLVARHITCSALGAHRLRGVSEPVVVHRALSPTRDGAAPAGGQATPFVGREAELEALVERFARAELGRGQVVLLEAQAGIGKSRLQQEARVRLAERAATWITCLCSAYHQNTALYAVTDFLERTLALKQSDDGGARRAKLESRLRDAGLPLDEAVPLLGALLSIPAEGSADSALEPTRKRTRTLELLVDLVLHLASDRPVVLAIEDLHWADPSTLEFLELLVGRIETERVLLILSFRPEFTVRWTPPPYQSTLRLERLSDRDAERMIAAWSLGRGVGADLRGEIVQRTDGVPLFIEELTKALLEADPGAPGTGDAATEPVIPGTLRGSLTARLDSLGSAKEVAQLGALLGREFPYEILEAVSSLDRETLRERLDRLAASGLVQPVGEIPNARFVFKHALVQDAAYDSMLKTRRRELHERVLRALQERFPTIVEQEPETLARHCEEAGRLIEAAEAFQRAGIRNNERCAYLEASRSFRRALTLNAKLEPGPARDKRELDLLHALTGPLFATKGYTAPELPSIYDRIRELSRTLGGEADEFGLLYGSWGFHCVRGDRRASEQAADEILAVASRAKHPHVDALAHFVVGSTAFYGGNHERALVHLKPVVERYREHEKPDQSGRAGQLFLAWLVQGWALALAGWPDQGWSTLQEAVAHGERLGDPFATTQAISHLVAVAHDLGREPDEFRSYVAKSLAISTAERLPQTLHSARLNAGILAALDGDDRGIEEGREAITATRAMGTLNPLAHMLLNLAAAMAQRGRHDEALGVVEEALGVCAENVSRQHEPLAHLMKGSLLWQRGEQGAGQASMETALRIAREHGAKWFELRAATALARIWAERGSGENARDLLRPIYDGFSEGFETRPLREAKELLDGLGSDSREDVRRSP